MQAEVDVAESSSTTTKDQAKVAAEKLKSKSSLVYMSFGDTVMVISFDFILFLFSAEKSDEVERLHSNIVDWWNCHNRALVEFEEVNCQAQVEINKAL